MTPWLQLEMVKRHGGQRTIMNISNPVPKLEKEFGHFPHLAEVGII